MDGKCLPILTKIIIYQQILLKLQNIKFQENPSSWSISFHAKWRMGGRQTNSQDEANSRFT